MVTRQVKHITQYYVTHTYQLNNIDPSYEQIMLDCCTSAYRPRRGLQNVMTSACLRGQRETERGREMGYHPCGYELEIISIYK